MKILLSGLLIVSLLGCVGSTNTQVNTVICANIDKNASCIPADINREACGIDANIPTCTSGNDFGGSVNIPSIPGVDITTPTIPTLPPTEDNTTASGEVTDSVCSKVQFGVGFAGVFAQSYGVQFTYKGVAGYKEKLWCSYSGSNGDGSITAYQNPFVDDVWFVSQEDGKTGSTHIQNGSMVEVCDEEKCTPMQGFG